MTASTAPAQELRALLPVSDLEPGCLVHPVTDDASYPHLLPGEFAVVDTTDRAPQHGELFLLRQVGRPGSGPAHAIMEVHRKAFRDEHGALGHRWWAAPYLRPRSVEELEEWVSEGRPLILSDGPFRPGAIEDRIVGRVTGILAAPFEEPKRVPAPRGGRA